MHHIDVHVSDIARTRRLFDAVMTAVGWEPRSADSDYASYWLNKKRPSLGFIADGRTGSGSMQLAFAVATNAEVDAAASAAGANGARKVDGPAFHSEYGDDYYAVFFEDPDGNKFEVCRAQE